MHELKVLQNKAAKAILVLPNYLPTLSKHSDGLLRDDVIEFTSNFNLQVSLFISLLLLINKYTKHKLTIIRCQRLIWRRSESYNVLLSYNENKN